MTSQVLKCEIPVVTPEFIPLVGWNFLIPGNDGCFPHSLFEVTGVKQGQRLRFFVNGNHGEIENAFTVAKNLINEMDRGTLWECNWFRAFKGRKKIHPRKVKY